VDILRFLDGEGRVLIDVFFEFIPMSLFKLEDRGLSVSVAKGSKLEINVYGEVGRISDLESCAIRMWELNEMEPVRQLERSGIQRSGETACECRGR